jgi:phosphoribosylamine-glycine ligase
MAMRSAFTLSDGSIFRSLPAGQDHKRVFEGNLGPNTGVMGVLYAPVPLVASDVMSTIEETILKPAFDGLKSEGWCLVGIGPLPIKTYTHWASPVSK